MKKVLAWAVVLALVLSSFTMAFAGESKSAKDFSDYDYFYYLLQLYHTASRETEIVSKWLHMFNRNNNAFRRKIPVSYYISYTNHCFSRITL